jgi:uncharacterized protein YkwD
VKSETVRALALLASLSAPGFAQAQLRAHPVEGCPLDGVLSEVAEAAARDALQGAEVTSERMRQRAHERGDRAASLRVWIGRGGSRRPSTADDWLRGQRLDPRVARCGVGRAGDRWAVLVNPRSAGFELHASRGTVRAEARFMVPVRDARVALLDARGRTVEGAVGEEIALPGPGRWEAQLVADAGMGPIPWARQTVQVGSTEEASSSSSCGVVTDGRTWLAALNVARAQDGVDPLRPDPILASIAMDRARLRAEQSTVAHALTEGDAPDAYLARRGIRAERVAENVARARSACEAFDRLGASPSHRRNRGSSALDAVGIGLWRAEDGWYAVELFALRPGIGS